MSDDHHRWLFENNVAGAFRSSLDGTILEVNRAFAEIFGYDSPEELEGTAAHRLYRSAEDREALREQLEREEELQGYEIEARGREGRPLWLLENARLVEHPETGKRIIEGTVLDVSDRVLLEQRLEAASAYDSLTGLPNRGQLAHRGRQALQYADRHGEQVALAYLDLIQLEKVNDRFGTEAGDRILAQVGRRLQAEVRASDTVARAGGDEFAVLLVEVADEADAVTATQRLRQIFDAPFDLPQGPVRLGVRIGLALYPGHAADFETLLRQSERAREQGEPTEVEGTLLYRTGGQPGRSSGLAEAVKEAAEKEAFEFHYQPIYRLSDERAVGAEALARWQTPDGQMRVAGQFVPVAERTGAVRALDGLAIRSVAERLSEWTEEGPDWIAVNLAARSFHDPSLVDYLQKVFEREGAPLSRLAIDVTERAAMRDPHQTAETTRALQELGVRVALDDIGTGYSALTHLHQLPADLMKINVVFVQGMRQELQERELLEVVVALAGAVDVELVAEGVETAEQYHRLRQIGCDYVQGHFTGAPVPADELLELVRAGVG